MRVEIVDRDVTRPLRRAVLRPTWPPDQPMHGDESDEAVHLAAFDENTDELVGTCLMLPRVLASRPDIGGAWQLRGMATADGRRGQGVGTAVLAAALAEVRRRGARLVWCEARSSALAFYRQHDFLVEGAEYAHAETGAPHHLMWRGLPD